MKEQTKMVYSNDYENERVRLDIKRVQLDIYKDENNLESNRIETKLNKLIMLRHVVQVSSRRGMSRYRSEVSDSGKM
jgi:hypothetical protein